MNVHICNLVTLALPASSSNQLSWSRNRKLQEFWQLHHFKWIKTWSKMLQFLVLKIHTPSQYKTCFTHLLERCNCATWKHWFLQVCFITYKTYIKCNLSLVCLWVYMYYYFIKIAALNNKKHDISDKNSWRLFHLKV